MGLLFFIVCQLFLVDSLAAPKRDDSVKYYSKSQRVQIAHPDLRIRRSPQADIRIRRSPQPDIHRIGQPNLRIRQKDRTRLVAKQDTADDSTETFPAGTDPYSYNTDDTTYTDNTDDTTHTDSTEDTTHTDTWSDISSTDTTSMDTTSMDTTTSDTSITDTLLTDPPTSAPLPPVSCSTNANCPSDRPFCQQSSSTCQSCLSDFDCRNSIRCNAECTTDNYNRNRCVTPVGVSRLVCQRNEVCYKADGVCERSCIPSGNSANGAAVPCNSPNRTLQVGKYCNNQDGVCYSCLVNADCGISKNATCNSQCKYISASYQYTCSDVTPCSEDQTCSPKLSLFLTTDLYTCKTSESYFLIPTIATLVVLLIAVITV